jgi:two-component system chemotaxis sensor kinase CheA
VDRKLAALKGSAEDHVLLNDISRAFHTLKGGAAVLNAVELANLCHLGEGLLDKMRSGGCRDSPQAIDAISRAATQVRAMLHTIGTGVQPEAAGPELVQLLNDPIADDSVFEGTSTQYGQPGSIEGGNGSEPNWDELYNAVVEKCSSDKTAAASEPSASAPKAVEEPSVSVACRTADVPIFSRPGALRDGEPARNSSIRARTGQPGSVLNLAREIGLTKNRLATLRSEILSGKLDADTLHALDVAVNRLDLLVSKLRNAVVRSRKWPLARLLKKYPRIASDVARECGKEIELVLEGDDAAGR